MHARCTYDIHTMALSYQLSCMKYYHYFLVSITYHILTVSSGFSYLRYRKFPCKFIITLREGRALDSYGISLIKWRRYFHFWIDVTANGVAIYQRSQTQVTLMSSQITASIKHVLTDACLSCCGNLISA